MTPKIVFFPVRTNSAKLATLAQVAHTHFERKEPLLFLVPDQNAWEFLDRLLWSTPAESFLPHPSKLIQIRLEFDTACSTLFNLRPSPLIQEGAKTIYELEDHTSSDKHQLSEKRYHAYRDRSFQIIVEHSLN